MNDFNYKSKSFKAFEHIPKEHNHQYVLNNFPLVTYINSTFDAAEDIYSSKLYDVLVTVNLEQLFHKLF